MRRTIRRRKAMSRLINDIKFTLVVGLVVFTFFGGMFGCWLIFGY